MASCILSVLADDVVIIIAAMLYLEIVIFHCESQRFRPPVALINNVKLYKFL